MFTSRPCVALSIYSLYISHLPLLQKSTQNLAKFCQIYYQNIRKQHLSPLPLMETKLSYNGSLCKQHSNQLIWKLKFQQSVCAKGNLVHDNTVSHVRALHKTTKVTAIYWQTIKNLRSCLPRYGTLGIPPTNVSWFTRWVARSLSENIAHFGSVLPVIQCVIWVPIYQYV